MKNNIIFGLFLFLSCLCSQAQIVRIYGYGHQIDKFVPSDVDSLISLPAMDWNTSIAVDSVYQAADGQVHVVVNITVGPDAHVARAAFGEDVSYDSLQAGSIPYTVLVAGQSQSVDFIVSDASKTCKVVTYTANNWFSYGEYYNRLLVNCKDYLSGYSQWFSTLTEWLAAGKAASAWPLSTHQSTGTYTYVDYFYSGNDAGKTISYRVSKLDPNQGQFKIANIMSGIDLILNYNVKTHEITIDKQWIGYNHSSYGAVNVTDAASYLNTTSSDYRSYYDPIAGKFYLRIVYYVDAGYFGYDYEYFQCDGFGSTETAAARAKVVSMPNLNKRSTQSPTVGNLKQMPQSLQQKKSSQLQQRRICTSQDNLMNQK